MSRGVTIATFIDRERELGRLAEFLKHGQLGLLLGAGVSMAQGLPNWLQLTRRCISKCGIDCELKDDTDQNRLMEVMDLVKESCSSENEYITLVSEALYEGVGLDISTTQKELLIALSSLMVGTTRAHVELVVTLNFDSILEWYLTINGLRVLISSEKWSMRPLADVEVVHYHGYLPHPFHDGERPSQSIVLSYTEISSHEREAGFWRERLYDFLRSKVFLAVGINPKTLLNTIRGYISHVNSLYKDAGIVRDLPYGFALFPPGEATEDEINSLMRTRIVPLETPIKIIPSSIWDIAQRSVGLKVRGTYI